jgi:hypothetical protein
MSKENNGWTKIDNENNLPSKTITYHVVINGKLSKALYAGKTDGMLMETISLKQVKCTGLLIFKKLSSLNRQFFKL